MNVQLTKKEQKAREMVCLPLDGLDTLEALEARVRELAPVVGMFKIGKESYTAFGPDSIKAVHANGGEVFLDLKYHDIPRTVQGAAKAAARHGVYMFNVHTTGGSEMMKAALSGSLEGADKRTPYIIGVTVLTSIDQKMLNEELRVEGSVADHALHLANIADNAFLDGVVCSALDLDRMKSSLTLPNDFMYVTPGIQGISTAAGADQKRVATPGYAVKAGSSILVIGTALTSPPSSELRLQAGYEILQDMAKHL